MKDKEEKMKVCIIGGCGHVGLPLALALIDKGHSVDILDIDKDAIKGMKKIIRHVRDGK